MKLVISSDWHPDKRTLGHSRLEDVRVAVSQTVDAAINVGASIYAFLGDLCDPDAGPVVLACAEIAVNAATRLQRAGIDSVWIAGNHDVFEDGSGDTSLAPLRPLAGLLPGHGRLVVAERPATFEFGEWSVVCLPFAPTSHAYDAAKYVEENLGGSREPTLVLGHLHLPSMHPGEESTEMARGRELMWPLGALADRSRTYCFGGHYHAGGVYSGVTVPGSLVRFTFGEEMNTPSYLIVDLGVM